MGLIDFASRTFTGSIREDSTDSSHAIIIKPIGYKSQAFCLSNWNKRTLENRSEDVDFDFTEGEILTPREIRDWARQLQKEAGDPQEILAGQIDRSQAAISKALREADESETRYVKTCIRIIEHYRDDVTIDYPRGRIELS